MIMPAFRLIVSDNDAPPPERHRHGVGQWHDGVEVHGRDAVEGQLRGEAATQPTHDVTVTMTVPSDGGALLSTDGGTTSWRTRTLTFSPSGTNIWSTAQTVTVIGGADDVDNVGDAHTTTISHAATSTDPSYVITNAGMVTVTSGDATVAKVDGPGNQLRRQPYGELQCRQLGQLADGGGGGSGRRRGQHER